MSYRVYAVRLSEQEVDGPLFLPGLDVPPKLWISHYTWLVRGEDGLDVVVDTGIPEPVARQRRVKFHTDPHDALARLGTSPEAIGHVILTHLHWDHCSAPELYPNATLYVQRREMEFWVGPLAQYPQIKGRAGDITGMVRLSYEGRVRYVDGEAEPLPGIRLVLLGGHTPGSQAVVMQTAKGQAVLAGDALIFYKFLEHNVVGMALDTPTALAALDRLRGMASSLELLIASHDPSNMERFPMTDAGVLEVV